MMQYERSVSREQRQGQLALMSITVRLWPDEKLRFALLAASRGLSEGALALKIIRGALELDEELHVGAEGGISGVC